MENHITLCSDNSVKRNKGNSKTFFVITEVDSEERYAHSLF